MQVATRPRLIVRYGLFIPSWHPSLLTRNTIGMDTCDSFWIHDYLVEISRVIHGPIQHAPLHLRDWPRSDVVDILLILMYLN